MLKCFMYSGDCFLSAVKSEKHITANQSENTVLSLRQNVRWIKKEALERSVAKHLDIEFQTETVPSHNLIKN